ncbi:MAG: glutathione S-transferase family protein [Myxococcota bacterium]
MAVAHAIPEQPHLVLCELAPLPGPVESHSPFCLKLRRALTLLELDFDSDARAMPSAFRHLNPRGKVPVLQIDGEAVSDSTRILARLDAMRPGILYPHRESSLWEEFADRSLNGFLVAARWADPTQWPRVREQFFTGLPWGLRSLVPERVRASVVRSLRQRDVFFGEIDEVDDEFVGLLDDLDDRAPASGFWLGDEPDAADLAIFAQLQSLRCSLTPKQEGWINRRRALARYLDRVDRATRTLAPSSNGSESRAVMVRET